MPDATSELGRLGPYLLLQAIGRGGMGEVWEAEHEARPGERVALKTLGAGLHASGALRKLLHEAQLVSQLQHPNIVRILDVGIAGDRCYFAMELLQGLTLAEVIERAGPLSSSMAVAIALQVLAALTHAQAACGPDGRPMQVVHRDLKPSNVFVTREGEVKLIDFGIARGGVLDATQTRTGDFRGSLAYASPEQVRGEEQDGRSDLFSLGLILQELLTGRRVFAEKNEAALVGAVLWSPILPAHSLNPAVPASLSQALGWALQRERDRRPATAADFAGALTEALAPQAPATPLALGSAVRALPPPAAEKGGTASVHLPSLVPRGHPSAPGPTSGPPSPPARQGQAVARSRRVAAMGLVFTVLVLALIVGVQGWGRRAANVEATVDEGAVPSTRPEAVATQVGSGEVGPPSTPSSEPSPSSPRSPADAPVQESPAVASPHPDADSPAPTAMSPAPPGTRPRPSRPTGTPRSERKTGRAAARPPPSAGQAWLTVDATPWARIWVDGRDLGVTPVVRAPLEAGRRRLRAVRADGARQDRDVVLTAGAEERVLVLW